MSGVRDTAELFRRRAALLCIAALSLQLVAPLGVLATPDILTVPGAGASREPLDAMQFNVPGFGDLSEAVNVANGNLYLAFDGISHNNLLTTKDEDPQKTIAGSGWNVLSRLRLDGFDRAKALAAYPSTLSLVSGDSSRSSYSLVSPIPDTAPDWITRYKGLAAGTVRVYQLDSELGKSYHSSWIALVAGANGQGVLAHAYAADGLRSTFSTDGEYADYLQTPYQQYRSAAAKDTEGAAASSPKTELKYLPGNPGLLSSVRDEWGRTTLYTWDTTTKVVTSIASAFADVNPTTASKPGRSINLTYVNVSGQQMIDQVTYGAGDGQSDPANPVMLNRMMQFGYESKVVGGQTRVLLSKVTKPAAGTGGKRLTTTYGYDDSGRVVSYKSLDDTGSATEPETTYSYAQPSIDATAVTLPAVPDSAGGATAGGTLANAVLSANNQSVSFTAPRAGMFDLRLNAFGSNNQGWPRIAVALNGTRVSEFDIDKGSPKNFNLGSMDLKQNDTIQIIYINAACCGPQTAPGSSPVNGRNVYLNSVTLMPSFPDASNQVTVDQGNKKSAYIFDAQGQLVSDSQRDYTPNGGAADADRTLYHRYRYYPDGNVGVITQGYLVNSVYHDGKTMHMAYDPAGNLIRQAEYATPQNFDGTIGQPLSVNINGFSSSGTKAGYSGIVQLGMNFTLTTQVSGDPDRKGVQWSVNEAAINTSSTDIQTVGEPVVSASQAGIYTVTQTFTTAPLKAAGRERTFGLQAKSVSNPSVAAVYKVFVSSPVVSLSVSIDGKVSTPTRIEEKLIIAPNCLRRFGLTGSPPAFLDTGCKPSLTVQPIAEYGLWALNPPKPTFDITLDPRSVASGASIVAGTPDKTTGLSPYTLTVPWQDMSGMDDLLTLTATTDISGPINLPFKTGYFGIRKASTGTGQWNTYGDEFSTYQYAVAVYNSPDPALKLKWTLNNARDFQNGCIQFQSSGGFFGGGQRPGRITASIAGSRYTALSLSEDVTVYTKLVGYDTGERCSVPPAVNAYPGGLVPGNTFSSTLGSGNNPAAGNLQVQGLGLGQQSVVLSTQTTSPVQTAQTSTTTVVKQVLDSALQPGYTHYETSAYDASNRLTLKTANAPMPISAGGQNVQYEDVNDRLSYSNFSTTVNTASGKQTFIAPKTVTTTHAVGSLDKTTSVATFNDTGLLRSQKLSWGVAHSRQTVLSYWQDQAQPSASYSVLKGVNGLYQANAYTTLQARQYGDQVFQRSETTATGAAAQHTVNYVYDQFGHVVRETRSKVASGLKVTPTALITADEVMNNVYDGYDNQLWSQTTIGGAVTQEQGWSFDAAGARHSSWLGTPGRLTTYSYDSGGRLNGKQSGVGDGHAGVDGTLSTVRSTVDYTLDEFGRVAEEKALRSGAGPAYDTTKYTYDTLDRVASKTLPDANASIIKTWYDDLGQRRLVQEPYGTQSWKRNTLGWVLEETAAPAAGHGVGSTTSFTYDPYGRVIVAETADASIGSGAADRQTTYKYDSEGREVLRIGAALRTSADSSGTRRWLTDPRRPSTVTSYDELGRKTTLLSGLYATVLAGGTYANQADAARTTYSYDDLDRLTGSIDAEGYETRLAYDAADRLTKTERQVWTGTESTDAAKLGIDKALYATSWTVSLNDRQPLVAVDPTGARTERRYNRAGDVTADLSQQKTGGPLIVRHAYTYTDDGLPVGLWEPKFGVAPTTFDPGNPGGAFNATSINSYSTGDLPSSTTRTVNDGTASTSTFEYTYQGKPSRITAPDGAATTSEYDYLGNATRMTDNNGFTTESVYDTGGHQLSVKRLARTTTVAGIIDGDEIDRVAGLSSGLTNTYTYDSFGNLTRKNERHLVTDYVYNSMGKVIAESRPTYQVTPPAYPMNVLYKYFAYRLDGQRVAETTATYSDGGELESAQARSGGLDFTSVGATAQKSGGLSVTRYDLTGRVTRVTRLGYPVNSTGTARLTETDSTFVNNGLGLRVQRSFTGSPEVAVNLRDPATGGFLTVTGQPVTTYQTYWKYTLRGDLSAQWNEVATTTDPNSKFNSFSYTYSPTGKRLSASRDVQIRLMREAGGTRLDSDPLLAASVGRVESDYNERDLLKTTQIFDQSPTTVSGLEVAPTTPQRTTSYVYYPDGSRKTETTSTGTKTTTYDLLGRPDTVNDSNGSSVTRYTADQQVTDGAGGIKVSRKVGTGAATITYAYTPLDHTVTTSWAGPPVGATTGCIISQTTTTTVGGLVSKESEYDTCDEAKTNTVHNFTYDERGLPLTDNTSVNGTFTAGSADTSPPHPRLTSFRGLTYLYNSDFTIGSTTINQSNTQEAYTYTGTDTTTTCDSNNPNSCVTTVTGHPTRTSPSQSNTLPMVTEQSLYSDDGYLKEFIVDTVNCGTASSPNCSAASSVGSTVRTAAPKPSAPVKVAFVVAAPNANHVVTSYALDSRGDRLVVKGGPNDGYIKRYDADGQVAMFYRYDQAPKRGAYSDFAYDPEGQQILTANSAFIHDSQGYTLSRNQISTYSADGEVQLIRKREGVLADTGATYFLWWQVTDGKSDSYAANDLIRDQTYSLADGLADVNDWNAVVLFDSKAGFNAPIVFQAPVVSISSSTGLDPATIRPPAQVTPPATSPGSTEVTPPVTPPAVVKQGTTSQVNSTPATTGSIGSGQAAGTVVTIGTVSITTPATTPVKPVAPAASGTPAPVIPVTPAQASGKDARGVVLLPPQNVLPPSAQAVTVQDVQAPGAVITTPVPVLSEAGGAITAPNQVRLPAISASPQDAAGEIKPPNSVSPVPAVAVGSPNLVIAPPDTQSNRDNVKVTNIIVTPLQAYQDQVLNGEPLSLNDVQDKADIERDLKLGKFVTPVEASLSFVRASNIKLGPDSVSTAKSVAQKIRDTLPPEKATLTLDLLNIAVSEGSLDLRTLKNFDVELNHVVRLDLNTSTGVTVNLLYINDLSKMAVVDYAATLAYGTPFQRTSGGFAFGTITRAIGLLNGIKQSIDQGLPPPAVEFDVAFAGLAGLLSRVRLPSFARTAVTKVATLPGCNSFTPNTPVRTLAGLIAIGTLTIGTQVLAFNEQTGQNEYDPITAVHRNIDLAITYLTLKDGKTGQQEAITTTPEHPFYVQAQADSTLRPKPVGHEELNTHWVGAGRLQLGDKIKQADGDMGTVANVVTVQRTQEMFNLTVETAHTFYIGENGWLVHNTGILPCFTKVEITNANMAKVTQESRRSLPYFDEYMQNGGRTAYDCIGFSCDLLGVADSGVIITVTPNGTSLAQSLRLPIDGSVRNGYSTHQVFAAGKYVWDPYFGSEPILLKEWREYMGRINPGATFKIVTSKK